MPTPQQPAFTRPALAPSLLAAVALVVGGALIDNSAFLIVRYLVAILALIVLVFAWRGRGWGYLPFLAGVAVLWNPVWPIPLDGPVWQGLQFIAAGLFIAVGIRVKVANPEAAGRVPAPRSSKR